MKRLWKALPPRELCLAVQAGPPITAGTLEAVLSLREASSAGRPIFLWGAGRGGQEALDLLRRHSLSVTGFVDSDPRKHGKIVDDLLVFPPSRLESEQGARPYLGVSGRFASEIAATLSEQGWMRGIDFAEW
jgi:hypothetical protein